jgi:leader peptidase (prepilin peptidase)/N-methyltransferase
VSPVVVLLGAAGAAWGLVADRVSARWPAHEAEIDDEGTELRPAGWVRPPGWRTPLVVAVGALGLAGAVAAFPSWPQTALFGAWALALTLLFATDLDQRLLPDVLTLPLAVAAVIVVLLDLDPFVAPAGLPVALLVAVIVPFGLLVLSIPFGAGAFGLGDVKFLIGFGILAGPGHLLVGLVAGVLAAGLVIVVLLALRRITLRSFVPYGPFLIIGALWALLGPGAG